jgi:hypothetical protein
VDEEIEEIEEIEEMIRDRGMDTGWSVGLLRRAIALLIGGLGHLIAHMGLDRIEEDSYVRLDR